ncbi:MAG: hypothetical protein AMJ59_02635 [Gammaproteobacteria bacterium SG8_31]|nr:MAG: hypothetical protein AMJ59_02635 [Gammaproteobacteria bacterium SG8_31]
MSLFRAARPAPGRDEAAEVASPCISICQLGEDGVCEGCLRTAAEIAAWPRMGSVDKLRLLENLDLRRRNVVGGA